MRSVDVFPLRLHLWHACVERTHETWFKSVFTILSSGLLCSLRRTMAAHGMHQELVDILVAEDVSAESIDVIAGKKILTIKDLRERRHRKGPGRRPPQGHSAGG